MSLSKMRHLPHPTDERRTIGRHFRTACGRWAGLTAFVTIGNRPVCAKCAAAVLIHEVATTPRTEA